VLIVKKNCKFLPTFLGANLNKVDYKDRSALKLASKKLKTNLGSICEIVCAQKIPN